MSQSFIQTELSEIGKSFREAVSRLQAIEKDFKELQALYKLSNSRDQDSVRVYHQFFFFRKF
jgi:hypothetical protein